MEFDRYEAGLKLLQLVQGAVEYTPEQTLVALACAAGAMVGACAAEKDRDDILALVVSYLKQASNDMVVTRAAGEKVEGGATPGPAEAPLAAK